MSVTYDSLSARWDWGYVTYDGLELASRQSRPTVGLNVISELTIGKWCREWTLTPAQTITYQITTDLDVIDVKENEVSLTERASVALVEANAGSWYHDGTTLYVSATTGTPFAKVVIAEVQFLFSKLEKIFNNTYYEPRIASAPNLSLRIEREFGGVGQIGGGDLKLVNHDGYFDALTDLLWDYGTVAVKAGFDLPSSDEAYADYSTVGTWSIEDTQPQDDFFVPRLREQKIALKKKIPLETYNKTDYPQMPDKWIGKPIPRAYGKIHGAQPAEKNTATKTFKVAGHAIYSFDAVRVKVNEVWTASSFVTTDLTNAEFTLGSDWSVGVEVSVDFTGRKTSGGKPMVNAADVVEDLLTYIGETNIDAASLAVARNRLKTGTDRFGNDVHTGAISLYLSKQDETLKWLGKITDAVGAYLFADASGQYHFSVFQPEVSEGLLTLTQDDIESFKPVQENRDRYSKAVVTFNERFDTDWKELLTVEFDANRIVHGEAAAVILETDVALSEQLDATHFAQRTLRMRETPLATWEINGFWQLINKLPGDQIRITYERRGFDEVLEILEIGIDLVSGKVKLLCGNLRGYARHSGFWVDDAATLPTRFSTLTGYGSGSLVWNDSWHDDIKQWARQNVGYWTDANGFASTTDAESYLATKWI